MKYSIIVRDDEYSEKIARQISHNIIHDKDLLNPDIVIAVGGEGKIMALDYGEVRIGIAMRSMILLIR